MYIQMNIENISWNPLKNERLKKTRGISFEEIIISKLIDIRKHLKKDTQRILIYKCRGYIWAVPFVKIESGIFLKTIYPSRKFTKMYKEGGIL